MGIAAMNEILANLEQQEAAPGLGCAGGFATENLKAAGREPKGMMACQFIVQANLSRFGNLFGKSCASCAAKAWEGYTSQPFLEAWAFWGKSLSKSPRRLLWLTAGIAEKSKNA